MSAPTVVQSKINENFNSGVTSITLNSPAAAGNSILVFIFMFGSTPPTLSDTFGNTYTKIRNDGPGNIGVFTALYMATAIVGTPQTISISPIALGASAIETSPSTLDQSAYGTPAGTPSPNFGHVSTIAAHPLPFTFTSWQTGCPSVTTTASDELLLGWTTGGGSLSNPAGHVSGSTSPQSGWTMETKDEPYGVDTFIQSKTVSSIGTYSFDASTTISATGSVSSWDFSAPAAYLVSLIPAAGAGGGRRKPNLCVNS